MYQFSWLLGKIASSFCALIGGIIGLIGVQRKSGSVMGYYRLVKALQITLAIVAAVIVIADVSNIAPDMADRYIEELDEEAKAAGIPPPQIDRSQLIHVLTRNLLIASAGSITIWSTFGGYGLYMIHSLTLWYKQGSDPSGPQFLVSLPQPEPRFRYATPLLQGQSPTIPVSQSV